MEVRDLGEDKSAGMSERRFPTNMQRRLRAGILGYGRMGRGFVAAMQQSKFWDAAAVYDICPNPANRPAVHDHGSIDAVGLFTLADARPRQIQQALTRGKHVLAEKPIAADVATEWQLVREIEASNRLVAVNLSNRNAWYHKDILEFIDEGKIGDLAMIRICHMTPGHTPLEGHGTNAAVLTFFVSGRRQLARLGKRGFLRRGLALLPGFFFLQIKGPKLKAR